MQAQSDLILPEPLPLSSLYPVTQEIVGFFIIENHVLDTTGNFRSERDVEELWEGVISRMGNAVEGALRNENDPDAFLRVKESLIGFIMTLEVCLSFHLQGICTDDKCPVVLPILYDQSTIIHPSTIRKVRWDD